MPHTKKIDEVYKFWFRDIEISSNYATRQSALWFGHDPKVDEKIRSRFSMTMEKVARRDHEEWTTTEKGLISCIVLLDQFTRNAFRGSSKMYQNDRRALEIAKEAVREGRDRTMNLFERVFLYLPFEHSEKLEDQQLSLILFKGLVQDQDEFLKPIADGYLTYAQKHFDVIETFGRFPHRNKLLGRPSSEKELEYLKAGGGF
ncbi:DUF924 domain-containing protein [bacterium]|nr:DUF924 domain-containing protein [bacterium]